jgi:hypothetical protein
MVQMRWVVFYILTLRNLQMRIPLKRTWVRSCFHFGKQYVAFLKNFYWKLEIYDKRKLQYAFWL